MIRLGEAAVGDVLVKDAEVYRKLLHDGNPNACSNGEAEAEVLANDASPRGLLVRALAADRVELDVEYPSPSASHDGASYLTGSFQIRVRQRSGGAAGPAKITLSASICRKGVCAAPQTVVLDADFTKAD